MPNLKDALEKAKSQQRDKETPKITKGIRPDMIIAGKVRPEPDSESRDKVETNLGQTRDTPLEPAFRTEDKVETKQRQKLTPELKTEDKVGTQLETQPETKQRQTEDKVETKSGFSSLVGLQRNLLIFLYESCRSNRSSETEKLSVEHIARSCETSSSSVKKTIQRLENRRFLKRSGFKNGRGGWTTYKIPNDVYQDLLRAETEDKLRTKQRQTGDKVGTQLETQPETAPPSSSRDLYSKESSTTQTSILDEVTSLDVSGLREFGITIETFKRAVQLHPNVTIEALSDLAYRLSELFKNPKERARIQNARGFVIKLVEQLANGVTPLDHIETPDERLMRELALAAQKKRSEQQSFEETLLQEAFEKWDRETLEDEKFEAVPLAQRAPAGAPRSAIFKEHFREKVWPECREQILKGEV